MPYSALDQRSVYRQCQNRVFELTSLCGFFHAFGMWFLFCDTVGEPISADNVMLMIFFSAGAGIVGAVAYPIVSGIFHCAFHLIKQIYIEVNQG